MNTEISLLRREGLAVAEDLKGRLPDEVDKKEGTLCGY